MPAAASHIGDLYTSGRGSHREVRQSRAGEDGCGKGEKEEGRERGFLP